MFNRREKDGSQSTVCVLVDDFMIIAKCERHLDTVLCDIRSVFGKVSGTRGQKHDYLGMVFDFSAETSLRST